MNSRKTIVIVAPYFPPHGGGLERYAYELARQFAAQGFRVVVITSGEGRDVKKEEDGLTIYSLKYGFKISNTPFSFSWPWKVRRILREEKPDLLHIHAPVCGLPDIAAFVSTVPYVVTYHSGSMRKGRLFPDIAVAIYESLFLPILLGRAAGIVSASDAVREGFLSHYSQVSVIPPAVDHVRFSPGSKKEGRILFVAADVSRATEYKGLGILIEALALLHLRGIKAQLDVVGDGDMREEYEQRAGEKGLAHNVRFLGRLQGETLVRAYKDASIFALPTANDSYPVSILEAMSAALPVVATRIGDIPRLVEDGVTGFLVPRDAEALAGKLEILLRDPGKAAAFGAAGRRRIVREYSWEERAQEYSALFSSLMRPEIIHVSAYYPPHVGGIERVAHDAAYGIAQKGHNVTVLTTGKSGVQNKSRPKVQRLWSFEFAHTPIAPALLVRLFHIPSNSIIHLHLAQAYWPEMVRLASYIRGIPYVAHFHLDVMPSGRFGPLFLIYKRLTWGRTLRGARKVIACSEEQRTFIARTYGVPLEDIIAIPNAIGEDFFVQDAAVPRKEILRLLYVGRLTVQKRVDRLIETMRHVRSPAHLTIVGDGEDRGMLEALARSYDLKNISFVGMKDGGEIREYHRINDLFLISSDKEGAPLSLLEAMAAGLPVIGADVLGIRELVTGVGILVEPHPENFAAEIDSLAGDSARRASLSDASKAKARQHTWPTYIEKLMEVYSHI